ncbi:hypothetical protein BC833DRAFT_604504 [Globomyces pollinis-pini]|nr:hypothetical protein BC833DRAFT_604504 [Globomyces pollinis-pini]
MDRETSQSSTNELAITYQNIVDNAYQANHAFKTGNEDQAQSYLTNILNLVQQLKEHPNRVQKVLDMDLDIVERPCKILKLDKDTAIELLDSTFFDFLGRVCSNIDASDSKGNRIHQTLACKRMQKLPTQMDFNHVSFRIDPFMNAFFEYVKENKSLGATITETQVKEYVLNNPYLSRYSTENRRLKSKVVTPNFHIHHCPDWLTFFEGTFSGTPTKSGEFFLSISVTYTSLIMYHSKDKVISKVFSIVIKPGIGDL